MMIRRLSGLCFVLFLMLAGRGAIAAEVIDAFTSDIALEKSGAMTVTETISVNAEGNRIRRGIFRDFPLTYQDAEGRLRRVDFDVISVKRDGRDEPWHTESISGGIRIYAGSEDVTVSYGRHDYVFTYRTNRQIRYFDDHDELYWNVTGNGWIFPILTATAAVNLPGGVNATDTAFFTGPQGATDRNAKVSGGGARLLFSTTQPLNAGEGLTIAVKMPKGSINPPSADDERRWWLSDNRDYFLGFGGLILVFLYYTRSWLKVGRDPARGVLVPRWDPPDGISPALVNYIDNRGFSGQGWTALSATALNLAVRGYVVLDDLKNSIIIRRTDKPVGKERLEAGEASLLNAVGTKGSLAIDEANGTKVKSVGDSFRAAIEREHRGKYYNANTGYTTGGIALSAASLVALFVFGTLEPDTIALMIIPIVVVVFLSVFVAGFAKSLRPGRSLGAKIMSVIAIAFAVFIGFSIVSSLALALFSSLVELHETPMLFAIGGIILLNLLYVFIMGAPTPLGAKLMDGIDGLRQYMTLAEKDRMNMAGAPQMSPQHFEKLLPYAVALGVEKPWSRAFETWLAAAAAGAAAAYAPSWYSGNFGSGNFSDRIGGFSSSMASTIASTIPAPPSSSSSGFSGGGSSGGFSGGGGGGGGGGGW
ncbi:putative membrane protein YgcG [Rhizobium sp. BK176]|nr:putative membrane protein YgcG [Rhizobium sp. BK399]MCS3738957.1 putative membrane protein YgcG [Rhizobium sp. BK661]MCS4090718.1 putative membrane protein YgcG [Rhizobium sp. BK176]